MKKLLTLLSLSVIGTTLIFTGNTQALSGSDFNAGKIIDDAIFFNPTAMNAEQIQSFLNAKVPNCDTNGTNQNSRYNSSAKRYYTNAEWAAANGVSAPFTCLKDYRQDMPSVAANKYCQAMPALSNQSSSDIIYKVSQACRINPQVMLVLLQKEQGLVGDVWPWPTQYRSATGFGCPDSGASCDSDFYGFFNQVYNAAKQFQRYTQEPTKYSYSSGVTRYVAYHPPHKINDVWVDDCGGTSLYIQNQATANLYNYTPYQPTQASLNNLDRSVPGDGSQPGTDAYCAAYGNRNFWAYFNNWFGTTSGNGQIVAELGQRTKTLTYNGQIYTFYFDSYQQTIRMATQSKTSGNWEYSTLDGSSIGGNGRIDSSMNGQLDAVVFNNTIQLYYYSSSQGALRHAWLDSGVWRFETLDGTSGSVSGRKADVGMNPSVAVHENQIQLFYYDKSNGNLRHAWTSVTGWNFENLDGDPGSVGKRDAVLGFDSTVLSAGSSLQVYYYNSSAGGLRHAWTDSRGWNFEDFDGRGGISGSSSQVGTNLVSVLYGGSIQLYYYDHTNGDLRHAWTDSRGWNFENLDGGRNAVNKTDADVGINPSITIHDNQLQLFYYDKSNNNLRHAWTNARGWNFENLDGDPGSVGQQDADSGVNVGVDSYLGSLQVYYYNRTNGSLRHAWTDSRGWNFEALGPLVIY